MQSLIPSYVREKARRYCASMGLDPDEIVYGYVDAIWTCGQRWVWYAR